MKTAFCSTLEASRFWKVDVVEARGFLTHLYYSSLEIYFWFDFWQFAEHERDLGVTSCVQEVDLGLYLYLVFAVLKVPRYLKTALLALKEGLDCDLLGNAVEHYEEREEILFSELQQSNPEVIAVLSPVHFSCWCHYRMIRLQNLTLTQINYSKSSPLNWTLVWIQSFVCLQPPAFLFFHFLLTLLPSLRWVSRVVMHWVILSFAL